MNITPQDVRHALVGAALVGFIALNAVAEATATGVQRPATPASYRATAYCVHGITASGTRTRPGVVAAGRDVPIGTRLYVEGYGDAIVEDRGGAITAGRLDVWFASCQEAINWG